MFNGFGTWVGHVELGCSTAQQGALPLGGEGCGLIVTREQTGDWVAVRHAGAKPDLRVDRSDLVVVPGQVKVKKRWNDHAIKGPIHDLWEPNQVRYEIT